MKKFFTTVFIILAIIMTINAQEKGRFRTELSMDIAFPNVGLGVGGNVDVRYNFFNKFNLGIMFSSSLLFKDIEVDNYGINDAIAMLLPAIYLNGDYFFSPQGSNIAVFLGGGVGVCRISNIRIHSGMDEQVIKYIPESKFAGFLRTGFEAGKFRLAVEYHLIPKSSLRNLSGINIGKTSNSYLSLSLGVVIGGGKWRNS